MLTDSMILSNKIKLGVFIPFHIPSVICHVFLIYHLIKIRQLREALHNHVILAFLAVNLVMTTIDLSMIYYFLVKGSLKDTDETFCVTWNFIDTFLTNLCTFLMLWSTLERHLLIFHDRQLFNKQFKRFIFHYMPMILLALYVFVFYFVQAFFPPTCSNAEHFHFDEVFCGRLCYVHANVRLSTFDLLFHRIFCSFLILFFCLTLFLRILRQKRDRNQIIRWRRHLKMTVQIASISALYLIGTVPAAVGELLHIFGSTQQETEESIVQEEIFLYLFYFISLIIPFICLMSLPEIYTKIAILRRLKRRSVHPTNATVNSTRRHPIGMAEPHI